MQLSDLRTQLRGWLQDTASIQWTDAQLNRYINLALRETEKHILAVDPEAFRCTYKADMTVPSNGVDNIYSYPVGTFAVHEIAVSSDGIGYHPLQRLSLKNARDSRAGSIGSSQNWQQYGSIGSLYGFIPYDAHHFMLWPSSSVATVNGIRVIVAPTLVMAGDTHKSPLPPAFETLNLKHAQLFALWDVGEPTETVQKEVDRLKSETPRFYLTSTEPAFITPMVNRGF